MPIRKAVAQEDDMGCGLACVAYVANVTYTHAQKMYFKEKEPSKVGYYSFDLVRALSNAGLRYAYKKVKAGEKFKDMSIVFIEPSKELPGGHWLVKDGKRWMNPWTNWPKMRPVKAGFCAKLPGKPSYVVFPLDA